MTAFRAVRKLPPAHVLEWNMGADGESSPRLRRYGLTDE
jgi:hypothetical protein